MASPTRTNDPEKTRQDIITVATGEFAAKGLSGARIDEIAARRAGSAVLTGQELAIGQAVDAFSLFFSKPAPAAVMRDVFTRELRRREPNAVVTA